ncbi:cbf nf-y family transcription factor [Sporothrix brasiliensis 5110]|uniref:DNA polymerase epsilon subunit D n=1 Tax=Sporothrix brasiliensis 5110 TaxID=1398154 RepID=A0A0C2F824_9PEZI|nr:cbf nf-y family transcription factor [Sporothrix brasiliensis 5110]KIH87178.1 cbf nf-y family transcription factor [Sporothrix brasiliensis 5110]
MPPRKSDAASRKTDTSASAAAVAADSRATAVQDAPSPTAVQVTSDLVEPTVAADTRPTSSGKPGAEREKDKEKEKEKEHPKSRNNDAVTIEDLNMPRSIVTRLAKGVLPPNTQIQGSAITGMSKSATVFISHLANAANTLTTNAGKKTIMPADVFAALDDIEFGFMREQLEAEFAKFTHIQTSKRSDYRKRVAAAKKGTDGDKQGDGEGADDADVSAMGGVDGDVSFAAASEAGEAAGTSSAKSRDAPPQAKKVKRAPKAGKANSEDDEAEVDEEDIEMAEGEGDEEEEEEDEEDEEDEDEEEEAEGEGDEDDEDDEEEGGDGDDDMDREDAPDDDEALDSESSE